MTEGQILDEGDTFIQPKIAGYRQLTTEEAALMNEAKSIGVAFEHLIGRLRTYHKAQRAHGIHPDESERLNAAEPERWLSIGRTHVQQGVMAICRSIAQPTS